MTTMTTELRIEPCTIPAADLGPENPLPRFRDPVESPGPGGSELPAGDLEGLNWHTGARVLPYRMQDGYNRRRSPRVFTSLVLENEHLRVRVLPETGGKIISIFDKDAGEDLIECNPVFQPGNLAIRDAWCSGGIEWNTAQLGHHCLTCSPVHAARVAGPGGRPVMRLHAWDRVRAFPFQIDLDLPPGSRFLYARSRVINPHDAVLPMYWWTNIGVAEREGRRVLIPADRGQFSSGGLEPLPRLHGVDASYATRIEHSYHFFGWLERGRRPWIAAIDPDGRGFVETSTAELIGRKTFVWGTGQGPRRWERFLSTEGRTFLELQAGLARTQQHLLAMPARSEWAWTEAFGPLAADPAKAHSDDWREAWEEGERALEAALPRAAVEEQDRQLAAVAVRPPEEVLFTGLGWGALERRRAAASGRPATIPPELPFPDGDLGAEQEPWLRLLEDGVLPDPGPEADPGHYMIQPEWRQLLEESLAREGGDHWCSWLHLGVMRVEALDAEGGREAFQRSLERRENGWALRNLADLAARDGRPDEACDLLGRAWQAGPRTAHLAVEYAGHLFARERFDALRAFLGSLPEPLLAHERLRLFRARMAIRDARYEEALHLLDYDFVNIREGETSLTDLWTEVHMRRIAGAEGIALDDALRQRVARDYPPPADLDFRMFVKETDRYIAPDAVNRPA